MGKAKGIIALILVFVAVLLILLKIGYYITLLNSQHELERLNLNPNPVRTWPVTGPPGKINVVFAGDWTYNHRRL